MLSETLQFRRNRLREGLGDAIALFYSGSVRHQNIASNVLPFRASSYFLFLFGVCEAEVVGLISPTESLLLVPERDVDRLIWEGEGESFDSMKSRTGVDRVLGARQLTGYLASQRSFPLYTPEPNDGRKITQLLDEGGPLPEPNKSLLLFLAKLRLSTDSYGLSELRKASEVTTSALLVGMANTLSCTTDIQLKNLMEAYCLRAGARQSFPSVVTVRGEVLHRMSGEDALRDGDLVLADVGAEVPSGYAGDCTRCWPVSGQFSPEQAAVYDIVKQAHDRAIESLEPGRWFFDVHQIACRSICEGLKGIGILKGTREQLFDAGVHTLFFPHGLGHLVGLDVHDMEDLGDVIQYESPSVRSKTFGYSNLRLNRRLCEGMTLTIEPGIYFIPALLDDPSHCAPFEEFLDRRQLERFRSVRGVRLEDTLTLHPNGVELLTTGVPIEREAVEKIVRSKGERETSA